MRSVMALSPRLRGRKPPDVMRVFEVAPTRDGDAPMPGLWNPTDAALDWIGEIPDPHARQ